MAIPRTQGIQPHSAPRPLVGIGWMIVTGMLFVAVASIVKHMNGRVPAAEAAFLRYILGLVFLIPMIGVMRAEGLSRAGLRLGLIRGVVHTCGIVTWFYAMSVLPVAEVSALNYLSPVFITLGAVLFLGEKLALRRSLAIGFALIGVVIILRPGFRDIQPAHLSMVFTAMVFGASYLLAKQMSGQMSATMVVGLLSLIVPVCLAPLAAIVWVTPSLVDLGWLFCVATLATAGHYTMTMAFAAAPITVTQPVTFLQLVWSVIVGMVIFGDPLDGYVVLGGLVILGSVLVITFREAQLRRAQDPR